MFHFSKAALALATFVVLCLGSAITAQADPFTIVGNSNSGATAILNITSLTNNQLCFTITNTSGGRITGFGFDLPGAGTYTLDPSTPSNTGFSFSTSPGNVPQFNSANLDFALLTGSNFAGGGSGGLLAGQTSQVFCINGNFSGLTQQQIANAVFVRFQSLPTNPDSDVGHGGTAAIPEPATLLLLGTGLAGVAAKARKRRKTRSE